MFLYKTHLIPPAFWYRLPEDDESFTPACIKLQWLKPTVHDGDESAAWRTSGTMMIPYTPPTCCYAECK